MEHSIFVLAGVLNSLFIIAVSLPLKRSGIIACSLTISFLNLVQFFITQNYASVIIATITIGYGLVAIMDNKHPELRSTPFIATIIALYCITYIFTSENIISWEILVLLGSITGMLSMMAISQVNVKIIQIIGNLSFMGFSLIIGAYGQIPGQVISLIALIISLVYLIKRTDIETIAGTINATTAFKEHQYPVQIGKRSIITP